MCPLLPIRRNSIEEWIYKIYVSSVQCLKLDILLERPVPINKGPLRCGHVCEWPCILTAPCLWIREHRHSGSVSPHPMEKWGKLAREGNKRNSLAGLLPTHARLSLRIESDGWGSDSQWCQWQVRYHYIKQVFFVSDSIFNLASESSYLFCLLRRWRTAGRHPLYNKPSSGRRYICL